VLGAWSPYKVSNILLALALTLTPPAPLPHTGSSGWGKTHSHCRYQALQMALFRRILSLQSNLRPLKFFHLGETSFPLLGGAGKGKTGGLL
jgi:hypothetical protein